MRVWSVIRWRVLPHKEYRPEWFQYPTEWKHNTTPLKPTLYVSWPGGRSRLEPALSVKLFGRWYKMRDTGRGMVNPIRRDNGVVGFDVASFRPMVFMDGLVAQR
jgi:hypothetical protein